MLRISMLCVTHVCACVPASHAVQLSVCPAVLCLRARSCQTLRIILQAEGPNGVWFRPREAVVRRLVEKQEDGVYVVLFHSVDVRTSRASDALPGELLAVTVDYSSLTK